MNNTRQRIHTMKNNIFFSYLGVLFLILPVLYYASDRRVSLVGWAFLILCYSLILFESTWKTELFLMDKQSVLLIAIIFFYFISWLLNWDLRNLYSLILCIIGLYNLHYFSKTDFKPHIQSIFKKYALVVIALLVPLAIFLGLNGGISQFNGYEPYFNKAIFKLLLPLSFFIVVTVKRKFLVWVPLVFIYLLMIERTSAMVTLFLILAYYFLPRLTSNYRSINRLFWVIIALLISFIVLYVLLFNTSFGLEINDMIRQLTNKNLFSGRQAIWSSVFDAVSKKPVFGYGFNPDVLLAYKVKFSPHNVYLYILLQTGFCGFILFIAYLYAIWQNLAFKFTLNNRISLSYFIALLVYMNFELTLVASTMVVGLYYSLAISLNANELNHQQNLGGKSL